MPYSDHEKQKEAMRNYVREKREREHYEDLKATIAGYQGRRKEIYDNLMIAVVDGVTVSAFREQQRTDFIAKINKDFNELFDEHILQFNIDDIKPLLQKHGIPWDQLTTEEKDKIVSSCKKILELQNAKTFKELREKEMEKALLQSDIMQLEHIVEGVELKFQLENNSNALYSKIRGIVKSTLWDAVVDDVTNKVKKELSK